MYLIKVNKVKATSVFNYTTGPILESARKAIREKNNCTIAQINWLSKKYVKKLYRSKVVHLTSKTQPDEYDEQSLFELEGKVAYTDVWYDTHLSKRSCFNRHQFENKNESCIRPTIEDNDIFLGHTLTQFHYLISTFANCYRKH